MMHVGHLSAVGKFRALRNKSLQRNLRWVHNASRDNTHWQYFCQLLCATAKLTSSTLKSRWNYFLDSFSFAPTRNYRLEIFEFLGGQNFKERIWGRRTGNGVFSFRGSKETYSQTFVRNHFCAFWTFRSRMQQSYRAIIQFLEIIDVFFSS